MEKEKVTDVSKMTKAQIIDFFTSLVSEKDAEIAELTQALNSTVNAGGTRVVQIDSKPTIVNGG